MTVSRIFGPPDRVCMDGVAADMIWQVPEDSGVLPEAVVVLDAGGVIAITAETDALILHAIDVLLPLLGGGHA